MKRLAVLAALVAMPAQAESPAAWTTPTEPFKIAGNLYYVGTAGIGAYLITTPQGHILIDGAMPGSAKDIEASITKLGFAPSESG